MDTSLQIRRLDRSDIDGLMTLNDDLLWTFTRADFETLLAAGILIGHIDPDGQKVTCAGLFPYEKRNACVGAVMVRSDHRRHGLATALMARIHALPEAQGRTLLLVATDEGQPLYEKCGYRTYGRLQKMIRPTPLANMATVPPFHRMRLADADDRDAIIALDCRACGDVRSALIDARWRQSYRAAIIETETGIPIAYGFGTDQRGQLIAGPLVAPDADQALALIMFLAVQHQGQIRIDVPDHQSELSAKLSHHGFQKKACPPIMVRNFDGLPGYGPTLWSIASQALG